MPGGPAAEEKQQRWNDRSSGAAFLLRGADMGQKFFRLTFDYDF
jgi:hypothetical protein